MVLDHIKILNYKNIRQVSADWSSRVNFIIGPNGSGKTNLLDAIYYSSMTRSYFSKPDKDLVNWDSDFFRLECRFREGQMDHFLVVKLMPGQLKEFEWDGQLQSHATQHLGRIPIVMVAPDDIYSFVFDSEARRQFLNQTLIQVDQNYLKNLADYHKLLKQKQLALKEFSRSGKVDHTLLDIYDAQMAGPARFIFNCRNGLVAELNPLINALARRFSNGGQNANLEYESHASEDLVMSWARERDKDLHTQRIQSGIHRDKLRLISDGYLLKDYGSQGQIKTFVLALRIAQYEYLRKFSGVRPILLLDDLFAKLDAGRVEALLVYLAEQDSGQCFITDNYLERASELSRRSGLIGRIYTLENHNLALYETHQ